MAQEEKPTRLPFLWRTGLYSYRQTIGAIVISIISVAAAWVVVHFFGFWLIKRYLNDGGVTDDKVIGIVQTGYLRTALLVILAAGGTALISAVFFTWLMSRSVTTAVTRVRQVAQRIQEGDHDVRVASGTRLGAEFQSLSQTFNSMAQELQAIERTRARLLGDLAHEMRTPLATLDAYLEAIGDGFEEANAETVDLLRHQTARLSRLAADVSLVARVEEGQVDLRRQPLAIAGLVRESVASIAGQYAEAGVELTAVIPAALEAVMVDGDPDRLGQVMTNLLANARRHTPAGGQVTVTLSLPSKDTVRIEVKDTGEGIPAEHLPHLFERFYRVDAARDRATGGTGIGLTIVKAMTVAHGGQVQAASAGPGQGATFTVTLPTTTA
ncbi:MAG: HAMP domain-containing protein [Propionibacteriaceae bacterium]|nr:HAMP domain-containing protein [Propionibacteriaceae bacterium]